MFLSMTAPQVLPGSLVPQVVSHSLVNGATLQAFSALAVGVCAPPHSVVPLVLVRFIYTSHGAPLAYGPELSHPARRHTRLPTADIIPSPPSPVRCLNNFAVP